MKKTKTIMLFQPMVIASGLSFNEANKLGEKATKSEAGKHIYFSVCGKAGEKTWSVEGHPIGLMKKFNRDPEIFLIEV